MYGDRRTHSTMIHIQEKIDRRPLFKKDVVVLKVFVQKLFVKK